MAHRTWNSACPCGSEGRTGLYVLQEPGVRGVRLEQHVQAGSGPNGSPDFRLSSTPCESLPGRWGSNWSASPSGSRTPPRAISRHRPEVSTRYLLTAQVVWHQEHSAQDPSRPASRLADLLEAFCPCLVCLSPPSGRGLRGQAARGEEGTTTGAEAEVGARSRRP